MRLRLDDYLLLSSLVFLSAATGLIFYGTPSIFLAAAWTFDPSVLLRLGLSRAELIHEVNVITRIRWAYLTLSWVCIFLIKFGFLSLFRHLVDRLPAIHRFWKGVLVFTSVVAAFAICDSFIACPKVGFAAGKDNVQFSSWRNIPNH